MNGAIVDLRDLWALPLEEQLSRRVYPPFGDDHESLLRVGRYFCVDQSCGTVAVVDPRRPWNDPVVSLHENQRNAYDKAHELTAKQIYDEVIARFQDRPHTASVRAEILEAVNAALAKERPR